MKTDYLKKYVFNMVINVHKFMVLITILKRIVLSTKQLRENRYFY